MRVLILAALLAAAPLAAQLDLLGQDAPSFHATVCVNPPADAAITMDACRGDVVLIKYWGPK